MDALLLTLDAQLGLAELVHKRYATLWPSSPLTFRIPVNGARSGAARAYLERQADCTLVESPPGIKASMAAILDGVPDQAWVFWCIDDRFPTWLDGRAVDSVCASLGTLPDEVEEVRLLRWKDAVTGPMLAVGGVRFHRQEQASRPYGFWHHHLVRAGLLRRVFLRASLADDAHIADVLHALLVPGPAKRLPPEMERALFPGVALVPVAPIIRLGEPLVKGKLTRNGLAALQRAGCDVPDYPTSDADVVYEHMGLTPT